MKLIEAKFELKDVLRDTVSGFKGIVMGVMFYATGCVHYGLAPQKLDKDGKPGDWQWFDESRVALVSKDRGKEPKIRTSGPDMSPRCY